MTDEDAFSVYDELLRRLPTDESPWQGDSYTPQLDVLRDLLQIPIGAGQVQQSGRVAKAFDAWIAHELRRAGFNEHAVWPRTRRPRVLPEDLAKLEARLDTLGRRLDELEAASGTRLAPPALRQAIMGVRNALPGAGEASILGDFYVKQIDVTVSSWRRGPEILISTKTMFSSYGKNLHNRHEEAVGEVSSLRRRHPMAAMGFAFLAHKSVHQDGAAYVALSDILRRLRRDGAFDASLLLVGDWELSGAGATVSGIDEPAADLGASRFFADIINAVTDRTPYAEHETVRQRRDGQPTEALPDDDDVLGPEDEHTDQ